MKKYLCAASLFSLMPLLSGCNSIGDKSTSVSVIYLATAVISMLLFVGYCAAIRKRNFWFLLLFFSVFIVNVGYLALSCSQTLEFALHANRLSYLGSVFLPMAMLFIILQTCNIKYPKWLAILLFAVSIAVFLIAASPGYLDIYYRSVELVKESGYSVLCKEYGPWHIVYLFYLLGYFVCMLASIVHSAITKKLRLATHAVILLSAVFVNIGVWLLEQLVDIQFEFLAVSYIVSELFLITVYLMLQEFNALEYENASAAVQAPEVPPLSAEPSQEDGDLLAESCRYFEQQLCKLTPTERNIYNLYLEGKGTKDIMSALNIKENTLKYHNKNIYGKLGVSSRKQLLEIAGHINSK